MLDPKAVFEKARTTERIWLGGEHEFPFGVTRDQAYHDLHELCCACGGVVAKHGRSMLTYSPTHKLGYYLLDWHDGDRPGPAVVHAWEPKTADANDFGLETMPDRESC